MGGFVEREGEGLESIFFMYWNFQALDIVRASWDRSSMANLID